MGPALNPFYWLYGLIFLAIAALIATVSFLFVRGRRVSSSVAIVIALGIFFLIFCGLCQWSLSGPPTPWLKPAREDIVGLWKMSLYSVREVYREVEQSDDDKNLFHTLEFKEDSTFVMANMPYWWLSNNSSTAIGFFDSGSGTWYIEKDGNGDWSIRIYITVLNGQKTSLNKWLYLSGRQNPYTVFIWDLNDPDEGIITFEK